MVLLEGHAAPQLHRYTQNHTNACLILPFPFFLFAISVIILSPRWIDHGATAASRAVSQLLPPLRARPRSLSYLYAGLTPAVIPLAPPTGGVRTLTHSAVLSLSYLCSYDHSAASPLPSLLPFFLIFPSLLTLPSLSQMRSLHSPVALLRRRDLLYVRPRQALTDSYVVVQDEETNITWGKNNLMLHASSSCTCSGIIQNHNSANTRQTNHIHNPYSSSQVDCTTYINPRNMGYIRTCVRFL